MQTDPRQTATQPPPPVGPTGFFTGVEIRPIIIGVVVDFIVTYVAFQAFFLAYVAYEMSNEGDVSIEKVMEYMTSAESVDKIMAFMTSTEGLMVVFVIGTLATAVGGVVAGWKATGLEVKHGALVGAGSLLLSFLEQALFGETIEFPEWFRALSVVAIIPAGALGGYVAEIIKSAAGLRPPAVTTGWPGHTNDREPEVEDRR